MSGFEPTFVDTVESLAQLILSGDFWLSVAATLGRAFIGLIVSLLLAFPTALLMARYQEASLLLRPVLSVIRSVPVISFILIALIFLDPESIPLLIAFIVMYPLLTENLASGLKQLDKEKNSVAELFHIGTFNRYAMIVYPQLRPFLFSGLASAVGFGWRAIIMGEVLSQCRFGIGSGMKQAQSFLSLSELVAWTIIAVVISFILDKCVVALSHCRFHIRFAGEKTLTDTTIDKPLEVHELQGEYGFTPFSYTFQAGKIYGISAPSGAGKTTFLRLLDYRLKPVTGTIVNRPQRIACLFQEPQLLNHLTVWENIALAVASFSNQSKANATVHELLKTLEIEDLTDRLPDQLSYGQQERVALARALAFDAPLILMDEPLKGNDEPLKLRICSYLCSLKQNRLIIVTSHDETLLNALTDVRIDPRHIANP